MDDEALFPGYEAPVPPRPLSADRRRTLRQKADVERGVHPLTKEPTRPDLGTCGDCAFRTMVHGGNKTFPKCFRPGVANTHSAATDVRAWWPACPGYRADSAMTEDERDRKEAGEWP